MSTYNDLENTRSVQVSGSPGQTGRWSVVPSPQPALLGAMTERNPKEVHLSNPAIRSARFTAPVLLALGAMNAWIAEETGNCRSLSTVVSLCV